MHENDLLEFVSSIASLFKLNNAAIKCCGVILIKRKISLYINPIVPASKQNNLVAAMLP